MVHQQQPLTPDQTIYQILHPARPERLRVPTEMLCAKKEENVLLKPGSGDPAEDVPFLGNFTVSQVPNRHI
jgi:hypothetical protein